MKKIQILIGLYLLCIIFLFLYSYTQVDLSLTLSKASIYQAIEKSFQYIGYFNRPLSTALFLGISTLLYTFYGIFLWLAKKNKLSYKQTWQIILITTIILTCAYNAFSYDLFNYIFDAKIVTHYHLNPYQYKALDFPKDPMLSFMHWTQRTYPYGPVWLLLTIPLSLIGFQYFLVTFFLFKLGISLCFIGSIYFLSKIMQKIRPKDTVFSLILFALNPLVLIESLVSAHNDVAMMFLGIAAFWFLLDKKYVWSYIFLLLSIGVKFATIFLLPLFFFYTFFRRHTKLVSGENLLLFTSICMIIPVGLAAYRTNFQPWYILYALPFGAMLGKKYYAVIPIIVMSIFSLVQYTPFLYRGDWNAPVPLILLGLTFCGIFFSGFFILLYGIKDYLWVVKRR